MTDVEQQWPTHAEQLADMVALPDSRWHRPIATTPRHVFIPRWFEREPETRRWQVCDGAEDPNRWMRTAYGNTASVVTKVEDRHADHVDGGYFDLVAGRPTSSATNPWRVVEMYRAARIHATCGDVLDVGTGSGYGCAVLGAMVGTENVTTIDVDPYLTRIAGQRLDAIGLKPSIVTADATGPLDWEGERIAAMVAVPAIPASWLTALRTGGRLAVNLAGTMATVTARKLEDGSGWGRVELDYRGGFMYTRGPSTYTQSYNGEQMDQLAAALAEDGTTTTSVFPVIDLDRADELASVLSLAVPGVVWSYSRTEEGWCVAALTHPDGSWARAEGQQGTPATVHEDGPRQLWHELDRIRYLWLAHGSLGLWGADVRIEPDGTTHITSKALSITVPATGQHQPTG